MRGGMAAASLLAWASSFVRCIFGETCRAEWSIFLTLSTSPMPRLLRLTREKQITRCGGNQTKIPIESRDQNVG